MFRLRRYSLSSTVWTSALPAAGTFVSTVDFFNCGLPSATPLLLTWIHMYLIQLVAVGSRSAVGGHGEVVCFVIPPLSFCLLTLLNMRFTDIKSLRTLPVQLTRL